MNRRGLLLAVGLLLMGAIPASAGGPPPGEDVRLAEAYAPVLYFHPSELFRPQPVEVMVEQARLRQARSGWFDVNILNRLSVHELFFFHGAEYFLDAWYGTDGASDYKNYSAHRARYAIALSPQAGGPPVTAYARIARGEEGTTIQYWLFYYYNDWFNKHEGDWEMVQVHLDPEGQPRWVVLSQHHGGTRRPWASMQVEEGTHPAVYVALGSHANYFWGDEVYPNAKTLGGKSFVVVDRTGTSDRTIPQVLLLPEREQVEAQPEEYPGMEWLRFSGNWGERAPQADFGGPLGPADKGEQWEAPYEWGIAQPPDETVWYAHRLRLEVKGDRPVEVALLGEDGTPVAGVDRIEADEGRKVTLLLHRDPGPGAAFQFVVAAPEGGELQVTTVYPHPEQEEVSRAVCGPVALKPGGQLTGRLCDACPPHLEQTGGVGQAVVACEAESLAAIWDAPDVVWLAGLLPAGEVVRGVGLALLAGLVPTALYTLALYWADRYEKEPKRLLAATFLWGAIPAILVAVAVRLFFRLPPSLLGPEAVEAVGAGLVAPLVEELLKGGAVLFVFLRYRQEFDDVLDGMVYGGMVGFGFAMTGNTVSYLGAFLLHGWAGLSAPVFLQGLLYGVDHALYTGVFGAGLGLARTMEADQPRWAAGLGGFLLAVLTHGLHNAAVRQALGLSPLTIVGTLAGVLAMAGVGAWALLRQRRILTAELRGEVPEGLYRQMTLPGSRGWARWQALRSGGIAALRRVHRTHQLCAELAFKKHQARRHPEEPDLVTEVARLRRELAGLTDQ